MLDVLAQLKKGGQKVLFISGEMNSIDMYEIGRASCRERV